MKLAWRSGILAYHDLHSCRNISDFQLESLHPSLASNTSKTSLKCYQNVTNGWVMDVLSKGTFSILRGDALSMNLHTPSICSLIILRKCQRILLLLGLCFEKLISNNPSGLGNSCSRSVGCWGQMAKFLLAVGVEVLLNYRTDFTALGEGSCHREADYVIAWGR